MRLDRVTETEKVLIDVIMQVTINLEPFNGTISLDHYVFNPCEFQNLYWNQLNGQYEDIVYKDPGAWYPWYPGPRYPYLTTCVSNPQLAYKLGSTQFALEGYCRNIDSNVSFHSFARNYGKLFFKAVKIKFRINNNPNPGFEKDFPKWVIHKAELIEFLSTCFVLSIGYANYITGRYIVRLLLIIIYFLNFYLIVIRRGSFTEPTFMKKLRSGTKELYN